MSRIDPLAAASVHPSPHTSSATAHASSTVLAGLLIALAGLLPAALQAQSSVSVTADLAFQSRYLFAGLPFAEAGVTRPGVAVYSGGFTLNGATVFDHDLGSIMEWDLYGDYYHQLSDVVGLYGGAAVYWFDLGTEWTATPEVYGGLVFSLPLTPSLYVGHDFDLGDGTHAQLNLSHVVPVGERGVTLAFVGNVDYNDGYYVEASGFAYADLGARLDIPLGQATLSPRVVIQRALDDAVFTDEEYFTIRASYAF